MKNYDSKLKAIRNVKKKLALVKVTDVAAEMNCSRQNIYFHLDESRYEAVSIEHLQKISDAIDKVKKVNDKKLASLI